MELGLSRRAVYHWIQTVQLDRDGAQSPYIGRGLSLEFHRRIIELSQRRERDRMRADYVSRVSHEPRTLLTSISGTIGLLQAGAVVVLPTGAVEMVQIAYKKSARLVRLINDIIDIGRLEVGPILHLLSIPLAERIPPAFAPSKRQPSAPRNRE